MTQRQFNVIVSLFIGIVFLVVMLGVSLKHHHSAALSAIQDQPKVVQPPKQPVYLMVRCPKGGGDVVFNITDDIALRQVYPN